MAAAAASVSASAAVPNSAPVTSAAAGSAGVASGIGGGGVGAAAEASDGVHVLATNLGFPRVGANRELKKALEAYWAKRISKHQLLAVAKHLRATHWRVQSDAGIAPGHIPSNDFALYDHVLAATVLVGAIPSRYAQAEAGDAKAAAHGAGAAGASGSGTRGGGESDTDIDTLFAMARGTAHAPAMEMTKWFDTNYHYIVPEFAADQCFRLVAPSHECSPVAAFKEALALGIRTRPVLLGPVSLLLLGKLKHATGKVVPAGAALTPTLLDRLLPVYEELLQSLSGAGAHWVQVDEPCFALDRTAAERAALSTAYVRLTKAAPQLRLLLATYFDGATDNLSALCALPVAGVHIDVVRAPPQQLDTALALLAADKQQPPKVLSVGVVDGRNVWRNDLTASLAVVQRAVKALGDASRVFVAPSCSLLHTPVDLASEHKSLDAEVCQWLAFAVQKLSEVAAVAQATRPAPNAKVKDAFAQSDAAAVARKVSKRIHSAAVKQRCAAVTGEMLKRQHAFAHRIEVQRQALRLPLYPTTTIGSFPQTQEIRERRAEFKSGKLSAAAYDAFLRKEMAQCVEVQEELGLDVLVHGEPERTDMVEYFGEHLNGFVFTAFGWVQSYGSRCVKPPIVFGDVSRSQPITVEWSKYAQSLTSRPMKGMLTGPITVLQWSFVRDDQPRSVTAQQIALALRDEVMDLESAGIRVIQIDEPALREGLPLRRANWAAYLRWSVDAFRLCSAGVRDDTQIHTHMCYAEFHDIIGAVAELDADVISIETSRSHMELLDAFGANAHANANADVPRPVRDGWTYPNEIGPGVYDIHSPRVASQAEMEALLVKAAAVLRPEQLWVNPDCGLKTRKWDETKACLRHMVAAAKAMRVRVGATCTPAALDPARGGGAAPAGAGVDEKKPHAQS